MNRYPAPQSGTGFGSAEWLANMAEILAVAALVGLGAFLVLWLLTWPVRRARKREAAAAAAPVRRMDRCRWKRPWRRDRQGTVTRWECKACGATGITTDGKPPVTCKRDLVEETL